MTIQKGDNKGYLKPGMEGDFRDLLREQGAALENYKKALPPNATDQQAVDLSSQMLRLPTMEETTNHFRGLDANPEAPQNQYRHPGGLLPSLSGEFMPGL